MEGATSEEKNEMETEIKRIKDLYSRGKKVTAVIERLSLPAYLSASFHIRRELKSLDRLLARGIC